MDIYLEISAVVFGLAYLIFLIREQKICWFFGVLSSLISIVLFYRTGLYSECILYVYYVIIGVYGFVVWHKSTKNNNTFAVTDAPNSYYLFSILIGAILAILLGYTFGNYTDAKSPYLDAFTTVFSFIASYFEVKKWLASWKFWIVINGITILLYLNRDLNIYTALTCVYFVFSFVGYLKWKRKLVTI